mgnify:CR=1 FL=1
MADDNNYISYTITVGGTSSVSQGPILSIVSFSEINKIPYASISIMDGDSSKQDFELSSGQEFNPGEKVIIELGYDGKNEVVFSGIIVRHRIKSRDGDPSSLNIECKHEVLKMCAGNKTAFFETKDDKVILTSLFNDSNVSGNLDLSGEFLSSENSLQFDASNWDYFMLRCEVNAKIVLFDGGDVLVQDPSLLGSAVEIFSYGKDILEFEFEADVENQYSNVDGFSWDSDKQKVITASGKPASFSQLENNGIKLAELGGVLSGETELFHGGEISEDELTSWANSKTTIASLNKVKGRIKITGNSSIKLGDIVEIKGVGDKFSGTVLVSAIKHEMNSGGWVTHIQFGLSNSWHSSRKDLNSKGASSLLPSVSGLQIGKVLKIDGDEKHRVQIALPVAGSDVTLWARMVFEDAGNKRGKVFWPEKDDEVIVGFLNSDPRSPVILGSLFSKSNIPPILADETNNEKGIISREGVKIIINDEDKSVNVETPDGNTIIINDKEKSIVLKDQNENSIKLEESGISIVSSGDINIKASKGDVNIDGAGDIALKGMNIKNEANAKFSAAGKGGAELTTSANAIIKGSMVQIN